MKKFFRYLLFIFVCLCTLPLVTKAGTYNLGTLAPGSSAFKSYAWWDFNECYSNISGPFKFTPTESYYTAKDSYYRYIEIEIDDYVDKNYNNVTVTCKVKDDPNHPIQSGRVTSWRYYYFNFNISAGGEALPVENPKSYYLYKGDTVNLKEKLGIDTIESFAQSVGSELGTISYTNCSGTNACTINFTKGTPLQDREHKFTIVYKGTDGVRYRSVVTAYENDTKRTITLGSINPTESIFGDYIDGVSNFTCSNSTIGVPAGVTTDGSGSKYRIKVTNNNASLSTYSNKEAKCTFKKDGKDYEYTYIFSLKKYDPELVTKSYEKYPGETVNIFSDLGIKRIVSVSPSFNRDSLTYTGCVTDASECLVTMKSNLVEGRVSTFSIYYYDTADKFKFATVTITEKSTTVNADLGVIGVGNTTTTYVPASGVTCVASDTSKPFDMTVDKIDDYSYRLSVKNTNVTVNTYSNLTITCSGVPSGVGGRTFAYVYKFGLSSETTPIENDKYFELFPGETLQYVSLFGIKHARSYTYDNGSQYNTIAVNGCSNSAGCSASFVSPNALHNRRHQMTITYVNKADVLYKTVVTIVEKDPSISTKAYPGLLGFCEFNSDWELASWADASGKNYTYYEATKKGAVLPDCKIDPTQNTEKLPLTFKGWTKGYKAGDALTTKSTCGTDLLAPGQPTSAGQTYAPCYEMAPHVRVSTNSGTLESADGFTFRASDMTYIKYGTSFTEKVKLPNVVYSGFHSSSSLTGWRNNNTGEVKAPGAEVYLDGSVWVAISNRTVTQVDLYKTVGLNQDAKFVVPNMRSCSLEAGSGGYVSIVRSVSEECTVHGERVTEFDVYEDVIVTMNDGTVRVYKFNVEDRSHILDDDNGVFNVDVEDDIVVGKNDEETLNDYKTDQCKDFLISSEDYKASKFKYGNAKANNGFGAIDMYTGVYKVYQLCPNDHSSYVALCLDPGRRGPNETGTGSANHSFYFKGSASKITRKGVIYKKTSDVNSEGEFGKLVMYIVKTLKIEDFDTSTNSALVERAAAHVAVRSMAIHTGFSRSPDPADEVYASHYYPYLGIADAITDALADDGIISRGEAENAVDNGKNGNGFSSWRTDVTRSSDGKNVRGVLVDLLSGYGTATDSGDNDGFSRTIDKTTHEPYAGGKGYTINYKGTITGPSGADVTIAACESARASKYGVVCNVNNGGLSFVSESGGRKTYNYDVTITVADASKLTPPTNDEEEKDVSFILTYTGGHDKVNAFITSARDSSVNVQRMLVISTTNPRVYMYFSVLPNSCDLDVLDADKYCATEADCVSNINNKKFNASLFKAAGCCRYQLNESSYIFKSVCSAECTSNTMTSVCEYVPNGKEKADFYEIKEGAQYKGEAVGYQNAIGTCIVNVSDYYVNDSASFLNVSDTSNKFTKYDDVENLINVTDYENNRYCQVTCKEDWQFSMDSFGNFIGADAVAAGTYFQIVSNDMFMSGKRTCYSTFINYDRFMSNVVDISNELVKSYNRYSKWSHVWTDIDRQVEKGYQNVKSGYYTTADSGNGAVCVEYFDKCPQGTTYGNYYWSPGAPGTEKCRMVRNYQSGASGSGTSGTNCESKPTTHQGEAYTDGTVTYKTNGEWNSDSTYCSFYRWTCDEYKDAHEEDWMNKSTKTCYYYTYYTKDTKVQGTKPRGTAAKTDPDGSGPQSPACPSGTTTSANGTCYYSCGTGYYAIGGTCYESTPSGWTLSGGIFYKNCSSGWTSYETAYCQSNSASSYSANRYELTMDPDYNEEDLKCKVWGKGYDYTLKTEDEVKEGNNVDGKDIYYDTKEFDKLASEGFDDRDSIANYGDSSVDNNRQNETKDGKEVKGNYSKIYMHDCTVNAAKYEPSARGSSSCQVASLNAEAVGLDSYSKTNEMFCKDGNFANLTGSDLDKAFCYVGGGESYTNNKADATKPGATADYTNKSDAFDWITENFKGHAKKELDNARFSMQSAYNLIYDHAHDLYNCQNFELRNTSDDKTAGRENNPISKGTIMGKEYNYVNIPTKFEPFATYDYDEALFMDRIAKEDRYLIQYQEKNDGLFSTVSHETGAGTSKCSNEFGKSTNCRVDATIDTPAGSINTKLSRNYIENYYYNPVTAWQNIVDPGDANVQVALDRVNNYHDPRYQVTTPEKAMKKIVVCTVGVINNGTGYYEGKDGEYLAFTSTTATPEWLGGRCYQVTVDYKKVHYVKTSIENSSYYKNKGYWYVRGGDTKIHGDDITDAINKFNKLSNDTRYGVTFENTTEEHERWSRLGSFNVFPVSMATPRNLYSYTYSFGNVGSYYDDKLGRIMGNGEQSIISQNVRTCVYEVYEEVCLCCGYKLEPDEVVEQIAGGHGGYTYDMSDPDKAGGDTRGSITFYTNSVSLGDIDLGRDSTLGTNWTANSPFMYNGDEMTTDKGHKLKENIEKTGENVYSRKPEYAYYLTPDTLKQIRSYNDANGYDLNLEKLILYDVRKIECDSKNIGDCKTGNTETINFQHYGSRFLIGDIDGGIELNSYGTIANNYDNVCAITDTSYGKDYDMDNYMKTHKCRWVDYIETNQTYYNPTTKTSSTTWFRLSFK